jgi:hypothetical protein
MLLKLRFSVLLLVRLLPRFELLQFSGLQMKELLLASVLLQLELQHFSVR